ncbi:MAG: hypothetical protein EOP85_04935 [Verrucomicrobiaceae bacterium]|nr:MAG: hypothetical protein EOP85_04935 [Verrucomicrobiaceae bacterium]
MDLDAESGLVGKTTIPPAFGVIPLVKKYSIKSANSDLEKGREEIGFFGATPLEYLSRWISCNEIFNDDVKLAAVIRWSDGQVSFGVTQPQYHGEPAEPRDIERYFSDAGWTLLNDPSQHMFFSTSRSPFWRSMQQSVIATSMRRVFSHST